MGKYLLINVLSATVLYITYCLVFQNKTKDANMTVHKMDNHDIRKRVLVCKPISFIIDKNVELNPDIREATCNCCFPHGFKNLINNENICKSYGPSQDIDLFIMIFTQHVNFQERQAIRQTWLSIAKNNTANVRYVFLLGEVQNDQVTKAVVQENELFKDFLKEDFVDTYRNQTLKTIMGLKWVVNYCRTTKYFLKTDDDTFINVPNVLKYIRDSGSTLKTQMAGSCSYDGPIRDPSSKWYTPKQEYKEPLYPGHCSGAGYLTSFTMVEMIYEISPYIPFFWLEDIYVSLCFRKVGGTVKHVEGFNRGTQKLDPCLYKGDKLFNSHRVTPGMMTMVWKAECRNLPNSIKNVRKLKNMVSLK